MFGLMCARPSKSQSYASFPVLTPSPSVPPVVQVELSPEEVDVIADALGFLIANLNSDLHAGAGDDADRREMRETIERAGVVGSKLNQAFLSGGV